MKGASWLPRGMMARLALVLIVALAIEFAGNALLSRFQEREIVSEERVRRFAEHLANAQRIVGDVERADRAELMAGMAIEGMRLNWVASTVITDSSTDLAQLARLRTRLNDAAGGLAHHDLRLSLIPSTDGQRDVLGALELRDGSFVTFRIHPFLGASPAFAVIALLHLLLVAVVLGVALLMIRALVRPLEHLARAADATGKGTRADIPLDGPNEVRRVASAFRAMQARLLQTMDDHTQALVAVSHDLRTPIQRLHLRAGLLPDAEVRDAMSADLADMEKFIASVTGFIQSGIEEETRLVDLAALAMTVVDNACDEGFAVEYLGPDRLSLWLKPLAMKRALANLVDNACRHAAHVRVVLDADGAVTLSVEDDGPGIPAARREEAFLPFQRLDPERSDHHGSGLGLAIARNAIATMDGSVALHDSALGGLRATITLPADAGVEP